MESHRILDSYKQKWTISHSAFALHCSKEPSAEKKDLELHYFWKWSAFEDFLLFCFGFTVVSAVVTLLLLDSVMFVETLGSLAVMFEAMLGIPQLLQNFHNSSTKGMS
ncbi:hypothetical protein ATANTOWER_008849 [Ataeniobius toweri]|uniref:Uncharacterized protein n=1 Tax=Ataeniobius toweri TaxID=208326 RepID=A0ABU7B7T0_9TELE|nr:hypothetical protein [Ataeniobius toweri]